MRVPGLLLLSGALAVVLVLSRTQRGQAIAADAADGVNAIGGAVAALIARGLRNNNPGNIRHSPANDWLGMSSAQSDPAFVQFTHARYGVRAIGRILTSYNRRGVHTIAGLIGAWAPTTENDTSAYVRAVARALAVDPDRTIDVKASLPRLAAAIIKHENGAQPYTLNDLTTWVYMA